MDTPTENPFLLAMDDLVLKTQIARDAAYASSSDPEDEDLSNEAVRSLNAMGAAKDLIDAYHELASRLAAADKGGST